MTIKSNLAEKVNGYTCLDNDYRAVVGNKKPLTKYDKYLLKCWRGLKARKSKSTGKAPKNTSRANTQEELCNEQVTFYYDREVDCMFVRKNSGVCFKHNNHPPVHRDHMILGKRAIPEESLKTAEAMLKKNAPTSVVDLMLKIMTNTHITEDSMQSLRRAVLMSKHKNVQGESTAATLLRNLEEKEGCNYCYITGSYSEAENLVRLRKVKKKKGQQKTGDDIFPPMASPDTEEVETSTDEETTNYVKSVCEALKLGDNEILLAVAWVTAEGKIYHIKYPRVLGFDVKFGTNNEKRPLCRVVGRNTNNKNLPIMNCFLPSQQRYVFAWIFEEAVPYLLDREALLKTSIMPTDEDPHECAALSVALDLEDSPYGERARHRLCKWHKVCLARMRVSHFCANAQSPIAQTRSMCLTASLFSFIVLSQVDRNYLLKVSQYKSEAEKKFISEVKDWLYSFTNYIETKWEEEDSLNKLFAMIEAERENSDIKNELLDFTAAYVTQKFKPQLGRLCNRHYKYNFFGWVADTCFVESENSATARDPLGPKPNHRLHVAGDAMVEHTDARFRKIIKAAKTALTNTMIEQPNETERDKIKRQLSSSIVTYANARSMSQHDAVPHLFGFEVTNEDDKKKGMRKFLFRNDGKSNAETDHRRPIYIRTRVIVAEEVHIDGSVWTVLRCGCGFFFKRLCACRHLYSLLDRPPLPEDHFPENYKKYEILYGEDLEFTRKCDERTRLMQHHNGESLFSVLCAFASNTTH